MFIEGVFSERTGRVGGRREDVVVFDNGDDVGSVAATGAFGVVCVDGTVFEGSDGGFDKAGFVERVGMD